MTGSQKATYRRAVCKRLERILKNEFETPTLITLQCTAIHGVPKGLGMKLFINWKRQAQRSVGRPFKFIKVIDYGPHPIPGIVFFVIVELPIDLGQKICGAWYMGRATAVPLDATRFDKIAASIMRQDVEAIGERPQLWSYCQKNTGPYSAPFSQYAQ